MENIHILPKGFKIATAGAGFKHAGRDDIGLIISETPCTVAGVFTTNIFKAAPVLECQRLLKEKSPIKAVLVNSGQANACTGDEGLQNCKLTRRMIAKVSDLSEDNILPMSTGVIGNQLKIDLWEKAIPSLMQSLGTKNIEDFTRAMMTTDAFPKFSAKELVCTHGTIRIAGMAKGAGMICPNMATMLAVVFCDAKVESNVWQKLFNNAVELTFNRVSVDGDTSTNDTVLGLANGCADFELTVEDMQKLAVAVQEVLGQMAYMLVKDGEGATKVMHINVSGAESNQAAEQIARTVGHSQLVKTAMYGRDANWGRIVAAVGRSGVQFNPNDVQVSLCGIKLFCDGQPIAGNHDAELEAPLNERDIQVDINMGHGEGAYTLLASDLSHDYVSCNADYRT